MEENTSRHIHIDPFDVSRGNELNVVECTHDDVFVSAEENDATHTPRVGSTNIAREPVDAAAEEQRQRTRFLLGEFLGGSPRVSISREASVASPHTTPSRPPKEWGANRQRVYYMVETVLMRSNIADAVLGRRVTQDASQKEVSKAKKQPPPHRLPLQLNVPFSLRCDFCQKFDSLCSNCHRKWKEITLKRRRIVAYQSYCKLPEDRRCALLFMTAAFGVGEFAALQLDFDGERCLQWRSPFFPLHSDRAELHEAFNTAGAVYALHTAFAYDRTDVACTLLSYPRCLLLRSENRLDPLEFLPQPLSAEWETILNASDVFVNHLLTGRAKQARRVEDWNTADALYDEVLQRKPDSEHAHSGRAKMLYDQGYLTDCIELCDAMISGETTVDWNEVSVETIQVLRDLAVERYHEYCHNVVGEGALKACGCIVLDRVRVPIRKLPFSIVIDNILAFCEGKTLWNVFNCSRMPLLRTVAEKLAVLLPAHHLQHLLEDEPGFHEMSEKMFCKLTENTSSVAAPPVRPLGVSVAAMADFNMFLVSAHAAGAPLKSVKAEVTSTLSLFRLGRRLSKESRQASAGESEVAISKQYRIHRASTEEPWRVKETGEWEIDKQSVEALERYLCRSEAC
ncbi:hypothetical protein DQ04_00351180 [Trypanosoma grayi]|uniref:hypothetical protein n=1 Tax=Trypanosoma grayi TaxID=71804 RepID=UPI0004F48864|nr:hypothetical protein DQ04_00351180 [Trypanosoma grayi]KEG14681.1 hypothetical protein DQ04_00351180 [Trypanosoma grayi]